MRREAEGGRRSGYGIGGELPGLEENPLYVVGSCQWRGDVGSCLENSNVLPFGPRKLWRGDVGPLVSPVSETKKITPIFCSHCNHPKWHNNNTKTTSAKTAKNATKMAPKYQPKWHQSFNALYLHHQPLHHQRLMHFATWREL